MISRLSAPVKAVYWRNFPAISHPAFGWQRMVLLPALVLAALGNTLAAQTPDPEPSKPKLERGFYAAKDRLSAMHAATLFVPGKVSEADIAAGPPQQKHVFQIHDGDKIICDFKTPGDKMGGNTPKFGCQITSVESADGKKQALSPDIQEDDPIKVKFGGSDNE